MAVYIVTLLRNHHHCHVDIGRNKMTCCSTGRHRGKQNILQTNNLKDSSEETHPRHKLQSTVKAEIFGGF